MVMNPPATQMWIRSMDPEDSVKEEMATYSSVLAWENPWTEEPAGYSLWGCKEVVHDLVTKQQQQMDK